MKNVQDIYPVSPMQEMMLLHAVSQRHSDTLFNQFCFEVDAAIDENRFRTAWQKTVDRHDALRTAFIWEDIKTPQQVVRDSAEAPFVVEDWRDAGAAAVDTRFADFIAADRQQGFDLRRAPLVRFALLRTGEATWRFVWSCHHLVVDRWCLDTLFADFERFYRDEETDAGDAPSFRNYIAWIHNQDTASAIAYWARNLRGAARPTRLSDAASGRDSRDETATASCERRLSRNLTQNLFEASRRRAVTPGATLQCAFALTLNRLLNYQDAAFGITVSGRPPDLPNVENIVGSFISNIPVRVEMPSDKTVRDWLGGVNAAQFERAAFEYLAPGVILACAPATQSGELFDAVVVWLSGANSRQGLPFRPLSSEYGTAYPVTLSVTDEPEGLLLRVDCRRQLSVPPAELLGQLENSLIALLDASDDATLGQLPEFRRDPEYRECPRDAPGTDAVETVVATEKPLDGRSHGRERVGADVLAEMVRAEWSAILGCADWLPDSNFFDAGGTSLQAARLHSRIEASMRLSIPVMTLFRDPTIDGMVKLLYSGDWPVRAEAVIGLKTNGSGKPLFCIASPEVNAIGYSTLAADLPQSQEVYVLQAPPASDSFRQLEPAAIPDFATNYVACIRRIQPNGPYRLLGMCDGAHIAAEMVRFLEADGETVSFLGIVNTWSMYTISRLFYLNRLASILRYYGARFMRLLPQRNAPPADAVALEDHRDLTRHVSALPAADTTGMSNPWIEKVGFAHSDPRRPKFAADTFVYRISSQPYWRIRDRTLGWSKQSSSVSVIDLSCKDHYAVMRPPFVRQLADLIAARLRNTAASPDRTIKPNTPVTAKAGV